MGERNNKKRKVAVYGRVSTDHESQRLAFENQKLWYNNEIEAHPKWEVVEQYFDRGITGTQAKKRPSFLSMIEDGKSGKFDLIITRDVSRFARNTLETLEYTRLLQSLDIEVYFIADNISTFDKDGEIRLTSMAANAQEESRKSSERIMAGQAMARQKQVLYGNGNILGYNRVGDTFVIDEEQAKTVKMIFQLYLEGKGLRAVKYELIKAGRKTSSGNGSWSEPTISRILDNPMYIGKQYQKQTVVVNYLDQRIQKNDKSDYVIVQGKFKPIMSDEEFEKVSKIKASRVKKTSGKRSYGVKVSKDKWMILMECGCGSKFKQYKRKKNKTTGDVEKDYACGNRITNKTTKYRLENDLPLEGACDRKSIGGWHLELMIKDILKEIWGIRTEAVTQAFELIKDNFVDDEIDNREQIKKLESKIYQNKEKTNMMLDLYADGMIDKEELKKRREKYSGIINDMEEELKSISCGLESMEENLKIKLSGIRDTLEQLVDFDKEKLAENLINQLVDKVIVRNDCEFEWFLNLSDIDTDDVFSFNLNEKYEIKREKSMKVRDAKYMLTFNSVISVERAQEYRRKYGKHIKASRWNDISYSVYVR